MTREAGERLRSVAKVLRLWAIGEYEPFIRMTDASLAKIMRALIATDGSLRSAHVEELPGVKNPNMNIVTMQIALPIGAETEFKRISGQTPQVIDIATGN
jgi:hypothetical protein